MLSAAGITEIRTLYAAHAGWLQNWLRRRTRCSDKAADLAHDTFCRLLERPQVTVPDAPRSYLATVARRLLIDDIRRREIERAVDDVCAVHQPGVDALTPERIAEAKQFLDTILRVLEELPTQAQQAFLLRQIEGLEQQDIARKLGISLSTVKRHIALAYAHCDVHAFDANVERAGALEQSALRKLLAKKSSRRRLSASVLGAAGLLLAGWLWTHAHPSHVEYQAGRGQPRTVELPDGSELTLEPESSISVRITGKSRHVELIRGQVLVSVSKDPGRPFVVETPHGTATALGTAFTVRRQPQDTMVSVLESQVRVCPGKVEQNDARCKVLVPGERARLAPDAVVQVPLNAWLEVDDQDVSTVLTKLNLYRAQPVVFDAQELRGLKVTGSFPLTDLDRALEGVARTAHLNVQRSGDGQVFFVGRRH